MSLAEFFIGVVSGLGLVAGSYFLAVLIEPSL